MKAQLKLSDIRKGLNLRIQKGVSMDLSDFIDPEIHGDTIDYDVYLPSKGMNLQRPFCWTLQQKQELIISILKGIELAPISVIIYKDDLVNRKGMGQTVKVIDGKQRISTVVAFVKEEFALNFEGVDYFYSDLEQKAKWIFSGYMFRSDRVYEYPDKLVSDDDKIAWFEQINFAGTPQDIEHLNNLKK